MLAEAFVATLHVLHVMSDPLAKGWGVDSSYLPRLLERTERNVREQLDEELTAEERKKFNVRVAVETGAPVAKIIEYAGQNGINLIVMGTHERWASRRCWSAVSRKESCSGPPAQLFPFSSLVVSA